MDKVGILDEKKVYTFWLRVADNKFEPGDKYIQLGKGEFRGFSEILIKEVREATK